MAAGAKPIMGHGQVKDQAPEARHVLEEAADLHVAAMLACACSYAVLRPNNVSGRAEQQHQCANHPIMRLGCI
jgi:hypothetical protein